MTSVRVVITSTITALTLCWTSPSRGDPSVAVAKRFEVHRLKAVAALEKLKHGSDVSAVWQAHRARPVVILGLNLRVPGISMAQRARAFLRLHPALFGRIESLRLMETKASRDLAVVRFQQLYRGIEVDGATVSVSLDKSGHIRAVRSDAEPIEVETVRPRISQDEAGRAAFHAIHGQSHTAAGLSPSTAKLVIVPGATPRLAHRVLLPWSADPRGRLHLVDAISGGYLGSRPGVLWHLHATREVAR